MWLSRSVVYSLLLHPEFVFQLNATDEFLSERVMNLPEAEVAGTQLEEEAFKKVLAHYRSLNGEDGTVLDFFDFLEIHPVPLGMSSPFQPARDS